MKLASVGVKMANDELLAPTLANGTCQETDAFLCSGAMGIMDHARPIWRHAVEELQVRGSEIKETHVGTDGAANNIARATLSKKCLNHCSLQGKTTCESSETFTWD